MSHPVTMYEAAKARQRDFLRQAEQRRLVALARQARSGQPGLTGRLLETLADLLSKAGGWQQRRHASHTPGEFGWTEQ